MGTHHPLAVPAAAWTPPCGGRQRQQGLALYVILILVLLAVILALWASRTAIFSEMIAGNDADYQRAFEAAQAMVQDAKDDIYINLYAKDKASTRNTTDAVQYPAVQTNFIEWASGLSAEATACKSGVCLRRTGAENFWDDETDLAAMLAVGARYGQYSGNAPGAHTNPILSFSAANKGAWYWVEPIPFKGAELGNTTGLLQSSATVPIEADMLFRITALALGIKGASSNDTDIDKRSPTAAVIQTIVALPVSKGE